MTLTKQIRQGDKSLGKKAAEQKRTKGESLNITNINLLIHNMFNIKSFYHLLLFINYY